MDHTTMPFKTVCCDDRRPCTLEVRPMKEFMLLFFYFNYSSSQVDEGVTMWSFTCWREGEIERDPELRAGRALKELDGWPEEVTKCKKCFVYPTNLVYSYPLFLAWVTLCTIFNRRFTYEACTIGNDVIRRTRLGRMLCVGMLRRYSTSSEARLLPRLSRFTSGTALYSGPHGAGSPGLA